MKRLGRGCALLQAFLLVGVSGGALARGVSPYLPMNLEPEIERQIERVLILADKPLTARPIAAATVLDALPDACRRDADLCASVRRYLEHFMHDAALTHVSVEVATAHGATPRTLPNRYGEPSASNWEVSAQGFWQLSDTFLVNGGGISYDGGSSLTGTYVSWGHDWAQLDIGYRPHWLSPMTDSSMLMSTQAPTEPSITLSNYRPLTRLGITYELFLAEMSTQPIKTDNVFVDGHPRLAGFHLAIEPVSGWSLAVNRVLQFGGAGRPQSIHDLFNAFFRPSPSDNINIALDQNQEFGNQAAAVTSRFLFPGKTPFAVYFEYAGEDASRGGVYTLGNAALAAGIDFPRLFRRFDLTYEISEWQNSWYVHHIYESGLTERGHVIGHWGGDERVFNDGVGAQSQMLRLGYAAPFGGDFELRGRALENQSYSAFAYRREHEYSLAYSRLWRAFRVGAEASTGRDVFGSDFTRVGAFFRYAGGAIEARASDYDETDDEGLTLPQGVERFVAVGANIYEIRLNPDEDVPLQVSSSSFSPHVALGARRAVSEHQDLGARIELDRFAGSNMISLRALDYRYRFGRHLAIDAFFGASTYRLGTPAIGVNFGLGLEWRDLLPGWDLGLDGRMIRNVARDRLLASDPAGTRPDIFYTVPTATFSIIRRF